MGGATGGRLQPIEWDGDLAWEPGRHVSTLNGDMTGVPGVLYPLEARCHPPRNDQSKLPEENLLEEMTSHSATRSMPARRWRRTGRPALRGSDRESS